ncbi:Trigger factor, ribosome-binding, bacterial [Trema orientale]|uniref:peptidylprolyl isomerase n=1 Tax=Trema orientale TaxID=63057 RepID=A0A2P5FW63_TREOI|nr:Trigger factor, ribosome-binding, bacterial [Trema orientale]
MASTVTTGTALSQFQQLQIPKFSIKSSNGCVHTSGKINFQRAKCFLFTSPQRRDFGLRKLICEAGSGLEASVADSEDAIVVKNPQIVVESHDNDKMQVRVELKGEETQRVFDRVLVNLARTAPPIPGFRREKGGKTSKVPKSFLLGILGEERVTKFVIQEIVSSTMAQYENLKVKDNKTNTTQSAAELKASFKPGSEFRFNAILEFENSEVETPS